MKYGVSRSTLLITAGVVILVPRINKKKNGIICWLGDRQYWLFKVCEASLIFLLFFAFIFQKLYNKHTRRISLKKERNNCPFSFFDIRGWIIMVLMILMGITIRDLRLLPGSFIAVFYTGLSVALSATGIRFLRFWWINRNRLSCQDQENRTTPE